MRDTLIEIINDFFGCDAAYYDVNPLDLATHLINSGVLVMPCKVDDTMYVNYKGVVRPVKVKAIRLDTKKNNHRICVWGTFPVSEYYSHEYKATFPFESIGKSLFRTEVEAKVGCPGQITMFEEVQNDGENE